MTTATLALARDGDRVLLLRRTRAPNAGLWSPPGGKLERDESALDCARREFKEETGLEFHDARLALIVAEMDDTTGAAWLIFVYVGVAGGQPPRGGPEGAPSWVALTALPELPKPPLDETIYRIAFTHAAEPVLVLVNSAAGTPVAIRTIALPTRGEG